MNSLDIIRIQPSLYSIECPKCKTKKEYKSLISAERVSMSYCMECKKKERLNRAGILLNTDGKMYRICPQCGKEIYYTSFAGAKIQIGKPCLICKSMSKGIWHDPITNPKKPWVRTCPKCGKEARHKNRNFAVACHNRKENCFLCAVHSPRKNKILDLDLTKTTRNCPACGKVINHCNARACYYAERDKRKCQSCKQLNRHRTPKEIERLKKFGERARERFKKNGIPHREYQYKLPDGREVTIQGYERYGIDHLIQEGVLLSEMVIGAESIPVIPYYLNDRKKFYFPDIYIKCQNTVVEIKSDYTLQAELEKNAAKAKYTVKNGYNYRLMVFDSKHSLVLDKTYKSSAV